MNIQRPTMLLDKTKAVRNIERMTAQAQRSEVRFRPHFKTHQSAAIGEWFKPYGVESITVSSVQMAIYFAQHGWTDITIAFPVNVLELDLLNQLAAQITLNLLLESAEVVRYLKTVLTNPVNIWLKADVGYQRTGIPCAAVDRFVELVELIEMVPQHQFCGILTHAGQTYTARGPAEIRAMYEEAIAQLQAVQAALPHAEISFGDTPSCSVVEDLSAVDEIRPGNFVFYDVMQLQIGSCTTEDIAVAVACPVVALHPERNEAVIYGGAVHLSKEFIVDAQGQKIFGYVALLTPTGWREPLPGAYVTALSQEHGIIKMETAAMRRLGVGDVVAILPVHSCLTVNLMHDYYPLEGESYEA